MCAYRCTLNHEVVFVYFLVVTKQSLNWRQAELWSILDHTKALWPSFSLECLVANRCFWQIVEGGESSSGHVTPHEAVSCSKQEKEFLEETIRQQNKVIQSLRKKIRALEGHLQQYEDRFEHYEVFPDSFWYHLGQLFIWGKLLFSNSIPLISSLTI